MRSFALGVLVLSVAMTAAAGPAHATGALPSVRINATTTQLYRAARTIGLEGLIVRSEVRQIVQAARRSAALGDLAGARDLLPNDLAGLTLAERRAIQKLEADLTPGVEAVAGSGP